MDAEITENDIMDTFGINGDDLDRPGRTLTTSTLSSTVC